MYFWTKDVVVDPHDSSQNTWYAGVWSGWGSDGSAGIGGLYRTSDRGLSWHRIFDADRVSSITIHPTNPNIAHVTTEREGLWFTVNLNDETPKFVQDSNYPFRQPERVTYHPQDPNEIWVSSFGGGLRVGNMESSSILRADINQNGKR